MKRLLLLGPVPERSAVGGLTLALANLVAELRRLGWHVDAPVFAAPAPTMVAAPGPIGALQRSPWFLRVRDAIPAGLRRTLSALLWSDAVRQGMAENLRWAEAQLAQPDRYDTVLVCPDVNVPGILALALDRHPNVAVLSLFALAEELRPRLWALLRRPALHPYFYRPAKASQLRCAIFASEHWRQQALAAGLPPEATHTIYFGILVGPLPPRPSPPGHRLLWVGRLSPEKGLHHLLDALPLIRRDFPDVTLTAIAGGGEAAYRRRIETLIETHGLANCVHLHPPVPREQLPSFYASHDALYFHSVFAEPVALVLMEAYANGIPVVANHADNAELVQDGQTCITCHPTDPGSIAAAFRRLFANPAPLTARARALVESKYSLAAMGEAFHRIL